MRRLRIICGFCHALCRHGTNIPGRLSATSLWQAALATLTVADRTAIDFDNLNRDQALRDLQQRAKDLQSKCEDKEWKLNWGGHQIVISQVLGNILKHVNEFKEIGDIIVQYDPVHAALPWAGFRFLMQVNLVALSVRILIMIRGRWL